MKPAFLVWFCYWPNPVMKGDKGGIFSKAADWKTLFVLKMKIQAAKRKNKNVVFKHFHQNIRPIWTNDWDNIVYCEESDQREVLVNKFGLSQLQLGILVFVTTPEKFCNFLSLERAFPALKLTENFYLNMNICFSWKMAI